MPTKRHRSEGHTKNAKKMRHGNHGKAATDLDYIGKDDYVQIGDFQYVRPYVFEFKTNFKPRWKDQSIQDIFCQEFRHAGKDYWLREVEQGRIHANGVPISGDTIFEDGMVVVHIVHRHESAVLSTPIPIVHNEDGFVVVSKPPSLPIHPCGTYRRNSLQFILKAFYNLGKLSAVHRLDKETSGLVILAKESSYAARFSAEIKNHEVQKTYLAEVHGIFPDDISECADTIYWDKRTMKASIREEGQEAKTAFKRIYVNTRKGTSIVECKPLTGRTHQIRIHLSHLGYSIVNDPLYGIAATEKASIVSGKEDKPSLVTMDHPAFEETQEMLKGRQSFQACDWNKRILKEEGRYLSCKEEGERFGCSNCPQVTNVKNVEVQAMFIHLHALKYESKSWSFEVPPPPWMTEAQEQRKHQTENTDRVQRSCNTC